jgi:AcrR family transcriptional regulator
MPALHRRLAESTREAILRTAAQTFLTYGYKQSSMDEIALEAGVARRTLYNQFGSKTALFDETIAHLWAEVTALTTVPPAPEARSASEVLLSTGRMITALWARPEAIAFMRLVIWESERLPGLGENYMNWGRRAAFECVSRLSREPEFTIGDCDLATAQFLYSILGEVLLRRLVSRTISTVDDGRCGEIAREAWSLFMTRYRREA